MTERFHRLLSFDLDGTLVDTAAEIAEAANRALDDHGIERQPEALIVGLIGAGTRELMLKLLARLMLERPGLADRVAIDAVLRSLDRHYAATAGSSAAPYPGCIEMLSALQSASVKLACVTNKEERHARRVLRATGLDRFFELLIGGDTLPERKPHRSVLRHVAAFFDCDPRRMAHLGDSSVDVAAADNAGVAAWAVSYGYNAGRPIADARPQRIFDCLADVGTFVVSTMFDEPTTVPGR